MGIYKHNPKHRNGNNHASQWYKNITILQEKQIWINFTQNSIRQSNNSNSQPSYGLNIANNCPQYLGLTKNLLDTFIAKFISNMSNNIEVWHGYPADTTRNNHDIPDNTSLNNWIEKGYINKAKMRKIIRGQKCNL